MILDLRKITLEQINGEVKEFDFDYKGLANFIYNKTRDIGELELARELYKKGEIEVNRETATALKKYIGEAFNAIV